ncbi:NADP+-dependent D-mannitol dehydrogenase [Lentinus tigrinus ALCF2SS1-7]|uniref:NADP+-dependent D-mannitol dehydrogenase n=1 Tax=Lentinus tigrinus ALCF2SS1-7 TaxID=1328758 RepID=UPI001165C92A|nr:NADP+-dependent D-mannitol dehydrogenase [Lentinus tigrinus ALCF2SS1-7]
MENSPQAQEVSVVKLAIPEPRPNEVLIKVTCCGVCGTDLHLHHGDFGPMVYPLVPGHEVVGVIEEAGSDVTGFAKGDRVVGDPTIECGNCFFCRRGQFTLCENLGGHGVTTLGGVSEYVTYDARKVFKIHNISDEEAALVEPTSCAIHGMDRLEPKVGFEALVLGAGPSGIVIAQLLKFNGAARVVIAANKGMKTRVARDLDAADEYVELDRVNPQPQWDKLKADNPYGFDVVVEATGSTFVANLAINYVRRGGTLLLYSVYDSKGLVNWSPLKICNDEIKIIGTFAQAHCFPRAVAYLDSGKIRVKGLVTDVFKLSEYQKALDKMQSRDAGKIAIKP